MAATPAPKGWPESIWTNPNLLAEGPGYFDRFGIRWTGSTRVGRKTCNMAHEVEIFVKEKGVADARSGTRIERLVTSGTFSLDGGTWDVDNNVWIIGDDTEVFVIDPAHDPGPSPTPSAHAPSRPSCSPTATTTTSATPATSPSKWAPRCT